jgi:hypothetical protein
LRQLEGYAGSALPGRKRAGASTLDQPRRCQTQLRRCDVSSTGAGAERLGWTFEGVMRGFMPNAQGGRDDYALYAITKADWSTS